LIRDEFVMSACNPDSPGIIKISVISFAENGISDELSIAMIDFQSIGSADAVTNVVIDSVATLADPDGIPITN